MNITRSWIKWNLSTALPPRWALKKKKEIINVQSIRMMRKLIIQTSHDLSVLLLLLLGHCNNIYSALELLNFYLIVCLRYGLVVSCFGYCCCLREHFIHRRRHRPHKYLLFLFFSFLWKKFGKWRSARHRSSTSIARPVFDAALALIRDSPPLF